MKRTPMKRGGGLKRKKPLRAKRSLQGSPTIRSKKGLVPKALPKPRKRPKPWRPKDGGKSWRATSKACLERDSYACQAAPDGPTCLRPANQSAHIHGLGNRAHGGRYNPDAQCSVCLTKLNDLDNLRAACSSRCNSWIARKCPGKEGQ